MGSSVVQIFSDRVYEINSIFTSYRTLYELYIGTLRNLKANPNTITAIENAKKTVEIQQKEIAHQLYAQGFILLTGAAEALLKDIFVCLLEENFTDIIAPPSINYSAKELQDILATRSKQKNSLDLISSDLGNLTVKKLYSNKNPIERINFQNVETTKEVLRQYFNIELTESIYLRSIHRHWQVRHSLAHNAGLVDQRFIANVNKVGLLNKNEKIGKTLTISKKSYDEASEDFLNLFSELDQLIQGSGLRCSMLSSPE